MGLSVTQMDTQLAENLGDPNGRRWDHAKRITALNSAQRDAVNTVLSLGSKDYPTFGSLTNLQAYSSISIETDGYLLSGLDSSPGPLIGEQGFIRARVTAYATDTTQVDMVHISPQSGENGDNYYTQTSFNFPYIRFTATDVCAEIGTDDEFPVTVDFTYIRRPKTLVTDSVTGYQTDQGDIDSVFHDSVVKLAEAYCRRMADDFQQYGAIRTEAMDDIKQIVLGYQSVHNRSRNTFEETR